VEVVIAVAVEVDDRLQGAVLGVREVGGPESSCVTTTGRLTGRVLQRGEVGHFVEDDW